MRLLPILLFAAVIYNCRYPLWPWLIASFFLGGLIRRHTEVACANTPAK